jgi:hypothetical protein
VTQFFVPVRKSPGDPPPDPRRGALIGLIVVAVLIAAGLFLTHVLRDMGRAQDCAMQGRTNCAPIETSPH